MALPGMLLTVFFRMPISRVVIAGPSMVPTLANGDRLVVVRTRKLRPGDLVVFTDPELRSRKLVKRVVGRVGPMLNVRGDNDGASRDSRDFGAIPVSDVIGVPRYRYGPQGAVGWLKRPRVPHKNPSSDSL